MSSGSIASALGLAGVLVPALASIGLGEGFRPGTYPFSGEVAPPEDVQTVNQALGEARFAPTFRTGCRSFYDEKKKANPQFRGLPFAPEQTFLVVIGRMP